MFKRGGIYQVNLGPADGNSHESCPCLVVSNNISNEFSPVVTIIPLSFALKETVYDFETLLPASQTGLGNDAKISSHVIITIDKNRVVGERCGFVTKRVMAQVAKALRFQLSL